MTEIEEYINRSVLVNFGLCATTPTTPWQHEIIRATDRNSVCKAVCLWRSELDVYDSFVGICRLWHEPVNPLDDRSDSILMAVLYFEDYRKVRSKFSQAEIEQALNGFRVDAALLSKDSKDSPHKAI